MGENTAQIVLNDRFVAVEWKGDAITFHNMRIMSRELAEFARIKKLAYSCTRNLTVLKAII